MFLLSYAHEALVSLGALLGTWPDEKATPTGNLIQSLSPGKLRSLLETEFTFESLPRRRVELQQQQEEIRAADPKSTQWDPVKKLALSLIHI